MSKSPIRLEQRRWALRWRLTERPAEEVERTCRVNAGHWWHTWTAHFMTSSVYMTGPIPDPWIMTVCHNSHSQPIALISPVQSLAGLGRQPICTNFCTNRKRVYDFLLVINSNLCPILHRFRDTAVYWSKKSPKSLLLLLTQRFILVFYLFSTGISEQHVRTVSVKL